jgi:hypothetical protein
LVVLAPSGTIFDCTLMRWHPPDKVVAAVWLALATTDLAKLSRRAVLI